jgi:hypothetical protein
MEALSTKLMPLAMLFVEPEDEKNEKKNIRICELFNANLEKDN